MKKIFSLKNKLRYVLALFFSACLFMIGGIVFANDAKTAYAESTSAISFETGASIRVSTKEQSGLRFTAKLTDALYQDLTTTNADGETVLKEGADLGMIIVPTNYIEAYQAYAEGTKYTDYETGLGYLEFYQRHGIDKSKIAITFRADMLQKTTGGYYMNGSLINLYQQNYGKSFQAVSYYKVNATDAYTYTLHTDERSVTQVSVLAIENENSKKPYTDDQLDILYEYANGTIPRVLYDASKQSHAETLKVENATVKQESSNEASAFAITYTGADVGTEDTGSGDMGAAGSASSILVIRPIPQNVNLDLYAGGTVYFTIKTNAKSASYSIDGSTTSLPADTEIDLTVSIDDYLKKELVIYVSGLNANDTVWISDISICANHIVEGWADEGTNHLGNCKFCRLSMKGEHGWTYTKPDSDHHTQSCSVCNVQTHVECTFEDRVCTVCNQSEWDTWVFAVLDDENVLHIFNRKLKQSPRNGGVVLTLDDGSTLAATSSNVYGIPYVTEGSGITAKSVYSYDSDFQNGFQTVIIDKKDWNTARQAVKVIVEDVTSPKFTTDWFQYFTNCTSMDLSKLDTSGVTDMSGMFNNCSSLTSLDVSNFNTVNVTDMSSMFGSCSSLTSLNVSNFNTANVTDMRAMFTNCSGLTELNVSKFNTKKVTEMSYMFDDCINLTSLDVSKFDTPVLYNTEGMFRNCSSLTFLDLRTVIDSTMGQSEASTTMHYMFYGCSKLTTIVVSDDWDLEFQIVANCSQMFVGCDKLVGGQGTTFAAMETENENIAHAGTLAHIDGKARIGLFATFNTTTRGLFTSASQYANK